MAKSKYPEFIAYENWYDPDEYVITHGSKGTERAWRSFCLGTSKGVVINFESEALTLKEARAEIKRYAKKYGLELPKPPKESR
jgi:hypothetical protein